MDERRAKTLEALSTFIESQRALFAQTQSDLKRLANLRNDVASTSIELCELNEFSEKLQTLDGQRLSEIEGLVPDIHNELEWDLFTTLNPAPLKNLAADLKDQYARQREPFKKQTAPLSELQRLVKTARLTIIDPVLSTFPELSDDEEEEPLDPEELRRMQERAKIRELKMRRIHGDPRLYGMSGLALRKPGSEAVFVRRDIEDESGEVDISMDDVGPVSASKSTGTTPNSALDANMDVDTPPTSVASPQSNHSGKMLPPTQTSTRNRRSTAKASASRAQAPNNTKIKDNPPHPPVEEKPPEPEGPPIDKKGKPRPETYKQAWSVEEQRLLERLLDEIPDGEKNRWLKISQAMNGKRTARQVASRVQKYYAKLKRFGVDVTPGSSRLNDS